MTTLPTENKISKDKNILLVLQNAPDPHAELQYLTDHFCGSVTGNPDDLVTGTDKKFTFAEI